MVTCYCNKPFAGRAMIECSNCLTWIHLSCAKIRKKYIPEVFYCIKCTNKFGQNEKDQIIRHSQASVSVSSSQCSNSNVSSSVSIKTPRHFKNIQETSRYREYDGNGGIRFTPLSSSSNSPTNQQQQPVDNSVTTTAAAAANKISNHPLFFHPYHHSVPVEEQINVNEYLKKRVSCKWGGLSAVVSIIYSSPSSVKG